MSTMRNPTLKRPVLLIVGVLLIAATLRAPITGVAPLLADIREAFALETAEAGALTTLPLLVFAAASPFCMLLAREYGLERSLFISLLLTACGILVRSLGPEWTLFLGTAIIGMGIAIANVLLPSLIKRDFPGRIAVLTSAYALTAGVVASLASAAAVPIASLPGSGWNWALGAFLVFPLIAAAVWVPQLSGHSAPTQATPTPPHGGKVWHSALAWQVTFFFGLNSLVYYVIITWLPAILTEAGYSPAAAGSLHGISQLATAVPGFFLGTLVARTRDQRGLAVAVAGITAVSLVGLMLQPAWGTLWAALFGIGAGATFILGLAFISLRAASPKQAATLSAMTQSVGYLVAAGAPPAMGYFHDAAGSWTIPLLVCVAVCLVMGLLGLGAGRSVQIDQRSPPAAR